MDILNTILINTFALKELKHRVGILRSYLTRVFFGAQSDRQVLSEEDLNWLKSLPEDFYQKFNKDNVYAQFEALEQEINKLTPLIIYLTFEPEREVTAQIGQYARRTFNSNSLLLDTKVNKELIAGCSLVWKGVLRDFSLRARIEAQKDQILESFKKYLR